MGRILLKISGLLLGLFLMITGLAKAAAFGEFSSGIVREFPMAPGFGSVCAFMIVSAEVLSGAGFYFRRTRRLSAMVAALLFVFFIILAFRKIIEGSEFQCDCFGILGVEIPLIYHFFLDVALAVIALFVAWQPTSAPLDHTASRRVPLAFLIPLVLCALILVWELLSSFRSPAATSAPEEKKVELDIAFPVKVNRAHRGTLVKSITSSGLLRSARIVELVPRVSGEIVTANAYEGKEVATGEIVATISRTEFRLAFERASSALLAAQIEYRTLSASPFLQPIDTLQARRDLEAAREHFQRVRTAYAAGRIDGPGFLRACREYEATRAYFSANREDVIANKSGLLLARESYERAKLELEATEVRAPFAGRIAGWDVAVGMQAHAGRALCSLVDLSRILIDADIVEGEAGKIHPGHRAIISCMAFPEARIPGIVRTVSPVIDVKTRMMRATIELYTQQAARNAPQLLLRPGMFASLSIETDRLEDRILVPCEALLVRDLRQLVFTMEHGLAKWHYVETGDQNREFVEIRSGLSERDTVIVEGQHALAHDARVFVKE